MTSLAAQQVGHCWAVLVKMPFQWLMEAWASTCEVVWWFPFYEKRSGVCVPNVVGITLVSLPGKVYYTVLERSLSWSWKSGPALYPCRHTQEVMGDCPTTSVLWNWRRPMRLCPARVLWGVLKEYVVLGQLLWANWSQYNQSKSCWRHKVEHVISWCWTQPGFSTILFMTVMDKITRQWEECPVGNLRIASLLFVDDVALLASLVLDLEQAPGHVADECEADGMRLHL